jgi:hypothetical protein
MNAEYEAREQRDLADENRGSKASKTINDQIRNRIVPTENGLESPELYKKPFGEKCSSFSSLVQSLTGQPTSETQSIASSSTPKITSEVQSKAAQQAYDFTKPEWDKSIQDDMREYLEKQHHLVVIYSLEDAVTTLMAIWEENGTDIVVGVTALKALHKIGSATYDAAKIAKAFGDLGMVVSIFKDKRGNERLSITTKNQSMKHILANGVRIKMNSKKSYAIDNPKVIQTGVSPKVRSNGYKGGFIVTFIISAAIHSKDLILDTEYLLVDWLGNVGSDLFKALLSAIAAELVLLALPTLPFVFTAIVVVSTFVAVGMLYDHLKINEFILSTIKGETVAA